MKTSAVFAVLVAAAAAVPLLEKRRTYTTTTTTEVIEYITSTTTVWLDALPTPSAQNTGGAFYNIPQGSSDAQATSSALPQANYAAPTSSVAPQPAPTVASNYQAPADVAPAAAATTAAPAPQAPAVAADPAPAPQPANTYVAPAAAPAPAVQPAVAAAAAPASAPVNVPVSNAYSGDMTYYDVGMGSCGLTSTADQPVVALAINMMNNPANPNNNPLCGKTITISYGGTTHQATVVDTCQACDHQSIDLSTSLFQAVAPNGDGRVHDVKWWFNN